ncbi:MAG: PilZ domain-containing protein [Candidatus Sulfotelmatobacter sp.]
MTAPDHDRRRSSRLKLRVPVEVFIEGSDSPIRGATSDISLTGCYIETIFPFPVGVDLELKLQIDGTLLVLATVVTCDPQVGNGIQFSKMLPEDIDELRAFLEAAEKEAAEGTEKKD